jgi:hypothetical protein
LRPIVQVLVSQNFRKFVKVNRMIQFRRLAVYFTWNNWRTDSQSSGRPVFLFSVNFRKVRFTAIIIIIIIIVIISILCSKSRILNFQNVEI